MQNYGIEFDPVPGVMENDMQRRQYEDVFVERISKDDVIGIAGYTIMPDSEDFDDKNKIRAAVQKTAVGPAPDEMMLLIAA